MPPKNSSRFTKLCETLLRIYFTYDILNHLIIKIGTVSDKSKNWMKYTCSYGAFVFSRVAQRKRAGPITQRSKDRNLPLLYTPL